MTGTRGPHLIDNAREWLRRPRLPWNRDAKIGVALGGGFARGIAHVGVLRALEKAGIPIHAIAGVSAGSIAAALYASGLSPDEIELLARKVRFSDVARWTISRLGLVGSDRMAGYLTRCLRSVRFEDMKIPLAVVASDLVTGKPVVFRGSGDVIVPIRSSCAYPGLFTPIRHDGHVLVDGMVSMEVPARPLREMGCTHVISVAIPDSTECLDPRSIFSVVSRSFQILCRRTQNEWRRWSDAIIAPEVGTLGWDSFDQCSTMVRAGEDAAVAALPKIQAWLPQPVPSTPVQATA
jgi:NTE family protein